MLWLGCASSALLIGAGTAQAALPNAAPLYKNPQCGCCDEYARQLEALGVEHTLEHMEPEPLPKQSWRAARASDITWAREHFAPWVVRRITGKSSGDSIRPKRPEATPIRTDPEPS